MEPSHKKETTLPKKLHFFLIGNESSAQPSTEELLRTYAEGNLLFGSYPSSSPSSSHNFSSLRIETSQPPLFFSSITKTKHLLTTMKLAFMSFLVASTSALVHAEALPSNVIVLSVLTASARSVEGHLRQDTSPTLMSNHSSMVKTLSFKSTVSRG